MTRESLIRLTWRGQETITTILNLLDQAENIEIALPADFNHTLFRSLNPEASVAEFENIDARGGPALLKDIAKIRGLNELGILANALRDRQTSVQLTSPPKLVITLSSTGEDDE